MKTFEQRSLCSIAGSLLFVGAFCRYCPVYDPAASLHRNPEMFSLAYSLYTKGSFADPFAVLATGPSAHLAPAMPAFLALLFKLFGSGSAGIYAVRLSDAFSVSLLIALLPFFSEMLGMGVLNGIIGACLWIAAKIEIQPGFEGFYAAILLAGACCCYRRLLDLPSQESRGLRWFLGSVMGVSILVAPTVAPIFGVWLTWEIRRLRLRFWKKPMIALVLLPALIVTPWTVRNYRVFHRLFLIRDDLGLELQVSNNDCAQYSQSENNISGCFFRFHPNVNAAEAQKVRELGETKYNDLKLRASLEWIRTHPAAFSKLSLMRFVTFWAPNESGKIFLGTLAKYSGTELGGLTVPTPDLPAPSIPVDGGQRRLWERIVVYLMTLLSVPGLVILYRRDVKSMALLASCLVFFPLIYYFVQFDGRYRYPILWVTFLLGSLPISALSCALAQRVLESAELTPSL